MDLFNPDFAEFIYCFNQQKVEYILVGGYAVIIRGYSRSTGDMDIWVNKSKENFQRIKNAILEFGIPLHAIPEEQFFSPEYDVFTFGRPPYSIEILTALKGVEFKDAFPKATIETVDGVNVRVIHINQLLLAKKAAGRYKDLNDIENLPSGE
jgi:hypothetical protein